ncbi:DNA-3-methyladenine glycosylase I [Aquirufa rosea]|uniref:DNA-3-methyladenine glycosylase I n=1 Tax=Aquirufa rosea TaxID=2509241 RepID=A0A4Q1C054_9BACT|nr:DNA-3-methyladenine glycosylase I [Aquirufa rosea]RXK49683.1 DNA-3-methyladenine glycosylase I [Aquirufa rosea]
MTLEKRCAWVNSDPLYIAYHDQEWGIPVHDDQQLFELLILEGFQSGLSWITILRKRDHFREAFDQFDYRKIAQWPEKKLSACLNNPHIIRNRLKINAVKMNAQAFINIQEKFGSFDRYIWEFVNYTPIQNHFFSHQELPSSTELSLTMSQSLKKHGFKFVGPTICYSFMQAAGLVNDHLTECFCYPKK